MMLHIFSYAYGSLEYPFLCVCEILFKSFDHCLLLVLMYSSSLYVPNTNFIRYMYYKYPLILHRFTLFHFLYGVFIFFMKRSY